MNTEALRMAMRKRQDELQLFTVCQQLIKNGLARDDLLKDVAKELQALPEGDDYDDELQGISTMLLGYCQPQYHLVLAESIQLAIDAAKEDWT